MDRYGVEEARSRQLEAARALRLEPPFEASEQPSCEDP
jgi:hypothetical protein